MNDKTLAGVIKAKSDQPEFDGLNWKIAKDVRALLPVTLIGPCAVTDWHAKTDDGNQLILTQEDTDSLIPRPASNHEDLVERLRNGDDLSARIEAADIIEALGGEK